MKKTQKTPTTYAAAVQLLATRAFPGQQGDIVQRIFLQQFTDGQSSLRNTLAVGRQSTCNLCCGNQTSQYSIYHIPDGSNTNSFSQHPSAVEAAADEPNSRGEQRAVVMTKLLSLIRKMKKLDEVVQIDVFSNTQSSTADFFWFMLKTAQIHVGKMDADCL